MASSPDPAMLMRISQVENDLRLLRDGSMAGSNGRMPAWPSAADRMSSPQPGLKLSPMHAPPHAFLGINSSVSASAAASTRYMSMSSADLIALLMKQQDTI